MKVSWHLLQMFFSHRQPPTTLERAVVAVMYWALLSQRRTSPLTKQPGSGYVPCIVNWCIQLRVEALGSIYSHDLWSWLTVFMPTVTLTSHSLGSHCCSNRPSSEAPFGWGLLSLPKLARTTLSFHSTSKPKCSLGCTMQSWVDSLCTDYCYLHWDFVCVLVVFKKIPHSSQRLNVLKLCSCSNEYILHVPWWLLWIIIRNNIQRFLLLN